MVTLVIPALGVLAGVVGALDSLPYIRDIRGGTTRPHRGTWLIWSALAVTVCFSQQADGATWSLVMAATQAAATTLVFALSIRAGEGGVSPLDLALIGLAALGVAGWFLAADPVIATAAVVVADVVGAAMMLPKAYRDPHSETLSTFALAGLSGLLAAGSVGALDPALLLYPVYYCVANTTISLVLLLRRRVLALSHIRPSMA
jgi:hypothetical protein